MSLSERSRAVLCRRLGTLVEDEEAVGEMLTELTAVEADQVATKDFVRAEIQTAVNRLMVWTITLHMAQLGLLLTLLRKG
jgi:Na+/H+ antiporter NhaB